MAERLAENDGIGNFTSSGIGLGVEGGLAGGLVVAVAEITSTVLSPIAHQNAKTTIPKELSSQASPPLGSGPVEDASTALASFELRLKSLNCSREKYPMLFMKQSFKKSWIQFDNVRCREIGKVMLRHLRWNSCHAIWWQDGCVR